MSAIAQAASCSFAQNSKWPVRGLFNDIRVQYGIKMGLAGLLALCLTQLLRLPYDAWAILTVLITMVSRYVGSAALNAITRVIGTIFGVIVGVWLVGNYTSTPIIFLPVFFLVMAFATYKFGQYGPRQSPYAYFILGTSTLIISSNGFAAPNGVWQLGLYRGEEIVVGVVSALLVSSILWPRYARQEFVTAAQDAVRSVEPLLSTQAENHTRTGLTKAMLDEIRHMLAGRLIALTNLRQAGARESSLFSAQLPRYDAYLVSLISVFDAVFHLAEQPLTAAPIMDRLRDELKGVYRGLLEEIRILSEPGRPADRLTTSSLNNAFANLEQKIEELRKGGFFLVQPIAVGTIFGSGFAALRSLRDEVNTLRKIRPGLPDKTQMVLEPKSRWDAPPTIDWSWMKIGVKGGLAATIAITLLMWIHPPGANFIPLMAWLRVVGSRSSFRLGGVGDLRALQKALLGCLVLAVCTAMTLAATPLLASYLAMNLALFFILFWFGFATTRITGITFGMQLGYLIISAFVGLNPQHPVHSQTIIDTYMGIGIGLFIGAAVRRFIWPSLPQTVLRENLLAILADVKQLLRGEAESEMTSTRLALRLVETYQVAREVPVPARWCAKEERESLNALTKKFLALGPRAIHLVKLHGDLPNPVEPFLHLPLQRLKDNLVELVDAFAGRIASRSPRRDLPTLDRALREIDEVSRGIRDQKILADYPVTVPLRTFDIVARYRAVVDTLNSARSLISDPQIHRYWGDYAL